MRQALWSFITVVCFATINFGAQKEDNKATTPDLSKLSARELRSCLDRPRVCGAQSVYDVSDELARRLPQFSTEQLLACFDNWKICGVGEGQAEGWPISDELARRGDPHDVLARYWKEPKWTIRGGIEHLAYHFDTPEVTAFMQRVLAEHKTDGEDLYWPANYLAKKCNVQALKMLSSGRHRNQGCLQYATTVELFGKCQYRPAIPYLVTDSLSDACLNVADAAFNSLHALYPDSPERFDTIEDMQTYFRKRARQEGFRVRP
jgi:hypothetical protein